MKYIESHQWEISKINELPCLFYKLQILPILKYGNFYINNIFMVWQKIKESMTEYGQNKIIKINNKSSKNISIYDIINKKRKFSINLSYRIFDVNTYKWKDNGLEFIKYNHMKNIKIK